jgi:hypothetical protein
LEASASRAKKAKLEDLHRAIKDYSVRLLVKFKGDFVPDLADDVAGDVLTRLDDFKGRAKFRTWVRDNNFQPLAGSYRGNDLQARALRGASRKY